MAAPSPPAISFILAPGCRSGDRLALFLVHELMALENASAVIAGEAAPDTLGVTAIDDHTLEVRLTTALPHFPPMVTSATTFLPVPPVGDRGQWRKLDPPGIMVGNGAYVLSERVVQENW